MTPVETPDHFGSGNSDGRAIDDDRCADIDIDHRRRWDEDRRFGWPFTQTNQCDG